MRALAPGAVGPELIKLLESSQVPVSRLRLLASRTLGSVANQGFEMKSASSPKVCFNMNGIGPRSLHRLNPPAVE